MRAEDTGSRASRTAGHWFQADPLWFKRAVFYEIHLRGFFDGNGDGSGDLRGLTEKLEYLKWLGIDCIWLLPMYPSPLKDGGYDIADFLSDPSRLRRRRRLHALRRPGAPARHARDRRLRHEPHLERPPVVPGVALEPGLAQARLVRVVGHRSALRGRAHHLHRHRGLELDVGPGRRRVLLAPLLPSPARSQLRQSRGAGGDAGRAALLARPRARRLPPRRRPLPLRARRHELREPARDPRLPAARARAHRRVPSRHACCWPRPTSGRPTSSSTSATATSATWRSTSRSCRACSWRCGARRRGRSTRSSPRRRRSPTTASGASSCATTTS